MKQDKGAPLIQPPPLQWKIGLIIRVASSKGNDLVSYYLCASEICLVREGLLYFFF